ncbi:MAG TPA: acyl carrier protein [Burkholderiaceae bacterium]|nr:acyl carrier protein [Burkholderiaceae bacterium]
MDARESVVQLLDEALHLNRRSANFTPGTYLLGALAERHSPAVIFRTVGTLVDFVGRRLAPIASI